MPLPPAEGAGQEGDEWRRPRPRRRDDGARPELALAGVEDEAVRGVCVYFQDVNRAPNVEAITLLVCGEIVDDVLGVREVPGPVVARHGHARHVGETRGGEQRHGGPYVPPRCAGAGLVVQDHGGDSASLQVERGGEPGLAGADDDAIVDVGDHEHRIYRESAGVHTLAAGERHWAGARPLAASQMRCCSPMRVLQSLMPEIGSKATSNSAKRTQGRVGRPASQPPAKKLLIKNKTRSYLAATPKKSATVNFQHGLSSD